MEQRTRTKVVQRDWTHMLALPTAKSDEVRAVHRVFSVTKPVFHDSSDYLQRQSNLQHIPQTTHQHIAVTNEPEGRT